MAYLRATLFAAIFYTGSILYVLAAFPAMLAGQRGVTAVADGWAWFHRWCCTWLLGIRTRIEGEVPKGPVLIAAKHQSMYETIDMVVVLDTPAVVLKKELADIPGWGRVAQLYGMIPVDREAGAAALRRMLRAAADAKKQGRPILIFPEGTRVAVGDHPPLQPGFAGLYRSLNLPVVAVAIDSGKLTPKGSFLKRPGTITMRFGALIPPGLPRDEIEATVHAEINALEP
ncbi:MAG TPA: lysophospholipid acyltransferase family protein [Allosphingosinicella sp.]|jgi:1-acyl-sn-glycerol-3-phosphate acyltransferase